jgi:hypothetical protein
MSRTKVDFSKHELEVIKNDHVLIHRFKLPDREYYHSVTFINTCGIMSVTGDFGNWIFCREFHLNSEFGGVSDGYWNEKLSIHSTQTYAKFDSEATLEEIQEFEEKYDEENEMPEEVADWVQELKENVDSELDYTNIAYREKPSSIDYECVPFGKKQDSHLSAVYDAIEAICEKLKTRGATE